jgi:hypothetical protein
MAIGQQPAPRAPLPAPAWDDAGGDTAAAPATDGPSRARSWPPADWPSVAQLTYTKELITVVLLLLALPWILARLARHPRATGDRLAARALP